MKLIPGEFHPFESAGRQFLYLVPSVAVFAVDETASAVLNELSRGPKERGEILSALYRRFAPSDVAGTIDELWRIRALRQSGMPPPPTPKQMPPDGFPLTTLVLNITNQCNLSCAYCYEYGDDKIVDTENGKQPKFMSAETARESVDFLLRQGEHNRAVHLAFFGGETLLNFPVVQSTIEYGRQRAADCGKTIDFSLTTNATLLRPEIIEFLAENQVGVTISIDGPKETQDQFRVFKSGVGSYDIVAPKVKELLKRHKSRPIGARVTLTAQTLDIVRTFRHLRDEIGFWEVGFAPVTTSTAREYAIENDGYNRMLAQFEQLAPEYRDAAIANQHHGFSNVKDTVEELHKGMSKAYPCGAGLGLMGVATDGDIALCHRFSGSPEHKLGNVRSGVDPLVQIGFLEKHHVDHKTDCSVCWARPLCAGGCYHEAHTRYGDTAHANLHYCDWIRNWTDICLRVYGESAERNPSYFQQLEPRTDNETSYAHQL